MFGLAKMTVLLAFTIAAFNLERMRSFEAKHEAVGHDGRMPRTRKKRRVGTWNDLLPTQTPSGSVLTDHPPE
ncbi:MAG TPA: hypothetical protein VGP44_07755 [Gemmatimonadales bacterium]|nr:hypothetical protein [Gemmatimonadales bacterium]